MMSDKTSGISRRSFLKAAGGAAITAGLGLPKPSRATEPGSLATLIDLSLCDGCPGRETPACVAACRAKNLVNVPEPVYPIPQPFPRGMIEDWSQKQDVTDRLTPYNYLVVQNAEVDDGERKQIVHIPRRCMHCDNPGCATICPFSANHKNKTGAVVIDRDLCFGGAKCRTVCPWNIPQRQSGVGLYLKVAPTLAGNGVMFKCDLCQDRLVEGKQPVCIDACPRNAMLIGYRDEIYREAERRAEARNGFIYGKNENGGTGTLYVSPVSFEKLNAAIAKGPGNPHLKPVKRPLAATDTLGTLLLLSPVVGLAAGIVAAAGAVKPSKQTAMEESQHE